MDPRAETPDLDGAFPRLSEAQIALLLPHGTRRPTQEGEVLFREGEACPDFFVFLSGKVAVVLSEDGTERVIRVHGPRRFLGELGVLTGQRAFLTSVVRSPGEVLAVPVTALRRLVTAEPTLGDVILRAPTRRS